MILLQAHKQAILQKSSKINMKVRVQVNFSTDFNYYFSDSMPFRRVGSLPSNFSVSQQYPSMAFGQNSLLGKAMSSDFFGSQEQPMTQHTSSSNDLSTQQSSPLDNLFSQPTQYGQSFNPSSFQDHSTPFTFKASRIPTMSYTQATESQSQSSAELTNELLDATFSLLKFFIERKFSGNF